jgi:hypothetical protein
LTQVGAGQWSCYSFFDITYRIDFIGKPGGTFSGMSGSTTGTIRMRQGSPASSGPEVSPTVASDNLYPVLGSTMVDPSNSPVAFHSAAGDQEYTELEFDFSSSVRSALDPVNPTTVSLTGTGKVRRKMPGRASYQPITCEASVTFTPTGNSSGTQTFETEMLSLNIIDGGVPPEFMIRESPTKSSSGRLMIRESPTLPGRYVISSFFDVFTELSVDYGATWTPASDSVRLEAKIKPTVLINRPDPPVPHGRSISLADLDRDGVRDLVVTCPSNASRPAVGEQIVLTSACDIQYTYDGLNRFVPSAPISVRIRHTFDDGADQYFDTEMLQLDLGGGTLPANVRLRESPTKASLGRTSIRLLPTGQWQVTSFFDVFTELSIDNGSSWVPQPPTSLEVVSPLQTFEAPPVVAVDDSIPVFGGVMLDPSNQPMTFHTATGDEVLTELELHMAGAARAPVPGTPHTFVWNSSADVRASSSSGGSGLYKNLPLEIVMTLTPTGIAGGIQTFDTEMLSLNISGGTFMIRESPTRASTGKWRLRESPTLPRRYVVESFFNVFTEISVDGGATWLPADDPIRLETKIKPTVLINRPDPPVPLNSGKFVGDLDRDGLDDLIITNQSLSVQPLGGEVVIHSDVCDVTYAYDGLNRLVTDAPFSVRIHHTYDDGPDQYYDTEMLQLDLTGGTLPGGVMLRESPTRASTGRTSIRQLPGGQWMVSSFFDIFTELSVDGGVSWTHQPPATVAYSDTLPSGGSSSSACASVATYPNDLYPFSGPLIVPFNNAPITYVNGTRLKLSVVRKNSAPTLLPSLGNTQVYNHDNDCDGFIDDGSGTGFVSFHTSGPSAVSITHSSVNGDVRVYDTEMLALDLSGSSGGLTYHLRESPTRASTGRTTIRPNGSGFAISSFFDIFTEISIDGGLTWSPAAESIRIVQEFFPQARTHVAPHVFESKDMLRMEPTCSEVGFVGGAIVRSGSFFDIFCDGMLPPAGTGGASSASYAATGRLRAEVSLDGGASFFDVFADASVMLQITSTDSTLDGNYYETEMLALDLTGGTIRLRESPTLPSRGRVRTLLGPEFLRSSFFDIFTEISLDGGTTWSPATSSMRMELDSATSGSITGVKWHDLNGNGVNDGEPGLANWPIFLADTLGIVLDTALTDGAGNYGFPDVPAGVYRVYEELPDDWMQTGGAPAYGFGLAPGQQMTEIDFGNFNAPTLTGYKFKDRNRDGVRDADDDGVPGWEIDLVSSDNPNPDIQASTLTGSFTLHLNGLPPGEPITGTVKGFARSKKYRRVLLQQGRFSLKGQFENGDIPTQMLALQLHGKSAGTQNFDVEFQLARRLCNGLPCPRGWDGTIKGRASTGAYNASLLHEPGAGGYGSFFDIFIECTVSWHDEASGQSTGKRTHAPIVFAGDLDGDGVPDELASGTVYNAGPVTLVDDQGLPAGTIDDLSFVVGDPVSSSNPATVLTDADGMYSFGLLPPGTLLVSEQQQPDWVATTYPPNPCVSTSGAPDLSIDFGNFMMADTLKFRTFSNLDWVAAAQKKPIKKPKPGKSGTGVPNLVNAMAEAFTLLGKGQSQLHVGTPGLLFPDNKKIRPSIFPGSYKDVFTTFWSKRVEHLDSVHRGMDFFNGGTKLITKRMKNLPATKQNNGCVEAMMALACNIALSDLGLTQGGLGELLYVDPASPYDSMTVRDIKNAGDLLMTLWEGHTFAEYGALALAATRINNAFACGVPEGCATEVPLDTVRWMGHTVMRIKDLYPVSDVPFLKPGSGAPPRIVPVVSSAPVRYALDQNYPNPFNPTTTIGFTLPTAAVVTLKVYNILGQEVASLINNELLYEGDQEIEFDASGFASGIYFYRLSATGTDDEGVESGDQFNAAQKMMLVK